MARSARKVTFKDELVEYEQPPTEQNSLSFTQNKVLHMIEEAKQLRSETSTLVGDFLELEEKFKNLRVLTKQTFKEVEKNSEDFDKVVYLDKVIKHLNDAERNMQYVPSVITRK